MERAKKFLLVLIVLGFALSAGKIMAQTAPKGLPEEFSWYGKSGALKEPVYDAEKGGYWWMPTKIPAGMENKQWGNRGYVFVGAKKEKVEVPKVEAPVVKQKPEAPVKAVEKVVTKVVEKPGKVLILNLKDVYFNYDSAKITPLAAQTLKENADILKANPTVNVLLVGSASPEGATEYNLKLSERRVNAVKDFLVKEGISAARLQTKAVGELEAEKSAWPFVRKVRFEIAK
jgi:outer membrane protein OmpA-like peptidoglycan-associated protein